MQDERILNRFEQWWHGELTGRPLMYVAARREAAQRPMERPAMPEDFYTDVDYLLAAHEARACGLRYLAEGFSSFSADLGPGSLALYLGAEPNFQWDTVWYRPCMEDLKGHPPLRYDPDNRWWRLHQQMMGRAQAAAQGRFRVNIPDMIENIDILAAMRGPQDTLYDLMDEPEAVMERLEEIDQVYFNYYDAFYQMLKAPDGSSSYTAFHILGRGRVAKIQCDFSAMMSPQQFRQFILPSLRRQTERLDHSLYHLDGPDAIRHVPCLMELTQLDALQWTCGAGQPDGGCSRWDPIYDQVTEAGKSLWVMLQDGGVQDWIRGAERLMDKYGKHRFYFVFPEMSEWDADILMKRADEAWT